MDTYSETIANYYDRRPEHEWQRLERHRTEWAVTLKALMEYLPRHPARILDCGGGPGRYAIELSTHGYSVMLLDLSQENLHLAEDKAHQAGVRLEGYELGSATNLSHLPDESFDAVLLMGPLYHLLKVEERKLALLQTKKVLRPGGILFAAFISRYAGHRDMARRQPKWITAHSDLSEMLLASGFLPPGWSKNREQESLDADAPEFVAYLAHPTELSPLFQETGYEVIKVLGVEGLVSMIEEQVNELSDLDWERWVDLNYRVASDPTIHGCVEHLLVVAIKPAWRKVLYKIVQRISQARLIYKVIGGASAFLQGVQLPVNDLDIEMDAESAYRFQELFLSYVVQPVRLVEGGNYLSHFGRFEIEGVSLEVMGDLQRREGDRWVSTMAKTQRVVDLDGVNVIVSSLEEETLAYIRRGRMDRAAQCLGKCDPDRMRNILSGKIAIGVL